MAPSSAKILKERIGIARILMRLSVYLGLWPIQEYDKKEKSQKNCWQQFLARYYRYLLHLPLTFTYTTLMWIETFARWERMDNILYISITELCFVTVMLNFWKVECKAWHFMQEISYNNSYALRNDDERNWWLKHQTFFAYIAFCYIGGGICVLCTAFGATLLVNGYFLPYDYWLPFDWHNAQNYWYAYGYELIAMSLTCLANVVMDMMMCYYLFHIALLYKLIGMRLLALHSLRESLAVKDLIAIIELHKKVKRLTLQCESLVSIPILLQILFSALILCLSAYRIQNMQISENPGQFFAMLQFSSVLTSQIFLPCYFANEITINSDALTNCVYNSRWEDFSPSTRKLMNIYMELLKKPVVIKAGNFFLVGLPIFTKTMNNAYSLLCVLLNMNK